MSGVPTRSEFDDALERALRRKGYASLQSGHGSRLARFGLQSEFESGFAHVSGYVIVFGAGVGLGIGTDLPLLVGFLAAILLSWVLAFAWMNFNLRSFRRGFAAFAPLMLLVLLLPLLTAEVWRTVNLMGTLELLIVGLLALAPMAGSVWWGLLGSVRTAFTEVEAELVKLTDPATGRADELVVETRKDLRLPRSADDLIRATCRTVFRPCRAREPINDELVEHFRWKVGWRFATLIAGVFASGFLLAYTLSALMVDRRAAAEWMSAPGTPAGALELAPEATLLALPGGIYVKVALAVALIGTAAFLALAITGNAFAHATARAVLNDPVRRALVLVRTREWLDDVPEDESADGWPAPPSPVPTT